MKRETFILGLLALLSYFTPGESHHFQPKPHPYQRLQQPIYHRRHSQVSSIYPRYGQYPRYFYVSQKQQAQKPQILPIQTPWQRVCPPGYTARLLHYHYSRFLCIPNKQLTSDKIETKVTTPAQTTKPTTDSTTPAPTTKPTTDSTTPAPTTKPTTDSTTPAPTTKPTTDSTTPHRPPSLPQIQPHQHRPPSLPQIQPHQHRPPSLPQIQPHQHRPQKYLLHLSLAPQQPYLHQLTLLTALPLLLHQVPPSKLQLCHLFNRCFSGFRCTLVKVGWDGMVSKLSEQFYLLG
ncbi:mucin 10, submandibular gland salivary mucin, isoform CRA_b [Rattus norvegicus]|uniref:Mucin 10, submandibular gland salivary mucin, isoform CRA_b n=1 Tax=Rattus norvegicus TaxID=10116 RepID=A6KKK2_RAT|nr:mucin 10, submandibular gland salivary mucin, isoform CRA_b [Rattus norvegicus]